MSLFLLTLRLLLKMLVVQTPLLIRQLPRTVFLNFFQYRLQRILLTRSFLGPLAFTFCKHFLAAPLGFLSHACFSFLLLQR